MTERVEVTVEQSIINVGVPVPCASCPRWIVTGDRFVIMPSGVHDDGSFCEYTACYLCAAQIIHNY